MDLRAYYTKKVFISAQTQVLSNDLINKIKNEEILMDTLPNSYDNYTGNLETEDYLSFCRYLESRVGQMVLNIMED